MKHLDKFDDYIAATEERLKLAKELKNSIEYEKCNYSISPLTKSSTMFVLIRKSDKKQLTTGNATDVKKYIKRVNIDHTDVFNINLIGVNIIKPELNKYEEFVKNCEDGVKQAKELRNSVEFHDKTYFIKRDDTSINRNRFSLIERENGHILLYDTAKKILDYIVRKNISDDDVFDIKLIKK